MAPSPLPDGAKGRSCVYLLRSQKDNKYYLGSTSDLLRRLSEHNEGLSTSTRFRRPFKLIGFEVYPSLYKARQRERILKNNPKMYRNLKKRLTICSLAPKAQEEGMG